MGPDPLHARTHTRTAHPGAGTCPTGDNPLSPGVLEIQNVSCSLTSGTFTLTFREETTDAISTGGSGSDLEAALEAIPTFVWGLGGGWRVGEWRRRSPLRARR